MKSHKMLLLAFLCSIFIGLRTYYYVDQFSESSESILNKTVHIQSDSITVDGSSLKMIGKVDGKKYVLYYSLKFQLKNNVGLLISRQI